MPMTLLVNSLLTGVDTSPLYPLGSEYAEPAQPASGTDADQGERLWVYVFNDEAATAWAVGTVVSRDAGTVTFDGIVAPVDTPKIELLGVAQHVVAAGSYGWILRRGIGEVLAGDGGITANTPLTVNDTDAGTALDGSATESCFAFATEAAIDTALATCFISVP